nr:hypothetical protein [Bacteroidota bacterium]
MKTKLTFLKKVLVFVMVMMLMGTFSFAQTIITIGTGTTTNSSTSYPAPYGNYWWGAKQQFLIRAADITAAGGAMGTISSLAFNVATVQGTALTGFTIKMGTTSQTAATTTFFTGLTTVLTTTSYTEVSGWNTHTFTTPFSWDGSSNLVIETCFNNTGYTSNAQVRNSTTTYASSIDRHADAAGVCAQTTGALTYSVRPNMRLGITMGTPPQKDLGILSWDSPNSSCGMSSAESVTIKVKNYGLASQNSYSLKYSTNGGTSWVTQAMTTAILPGDTLTHTFTTPANFATVGTYSCIDEVVLALDSNSLNNTLSKTIVATAGMATPYFNNLESMPTGYMTTGDWISSTTSNPAWQIDVSNTSSSNTGPNIDHTLGTSAGKYAYLETSGGSTGSTSYLTGPCANFSNQPAILNFWYHMYGAAMGTLEVQQKVGGTWIATGWSKTGQQHSSMGAAWTEATVSINPAADGIRFKGVRGTSYTSDMCIDDINLYVPMPNDLAMIEWTSPVAGTPPSATMPITVKVFNAGLQAQDTIPLKYSINGGTSWVSAISYPTLLPGDTLTYTFATTANMATPGYYSCIGVVSNPGDGAAVNDTIFNTPYLCSSLSGTYSLGSATTADFPSFSAAVFALNSCGVSGPVTINVDTGTYTEQVTIGSINGASATNTITFKSLSGINTDVILQYAATSSTANWTVRFNGSNYVNFKQITVKAIGASYGRVFELIGAANYNGIDSCKIMMPSTTSGNFAGIYSYTTKDEYNTFTNNQIIGGYYGLYFYGGTGTTNLGKGNSFVGNEITDYYYYGTYFYYHDSIQFNNNIVENRVGSGSVYGARFYYCDNIHVVGNKINVHGTSTHYGMYIYYADATSANPSIIANNFIALTGTGTSTWYGMYLYNSTYVNVYYNSYNLIAGSTSSRGLYMSSGTNQNYKNNIFKNSGGGYAAYFNTPTAILSSDYNDFYVSGTNLAYWSGNRTSLTALQTASSKDANSVNINPPFTSSSDLHLMGTTLSALGTPITSVTVDIDGTPRSATAPTIGAHEVPLLPWDAGVSNVTAPIANAIVNEASLVPLTVVVKNYGTNNITTMTIQYSVNNGTPVNYLYTGTILPNATETVNLTSFTATAGNSNVCVKTVLVGDSNYFNDEYCQPFFGTPLKDATILEIVEIDDDCNIGLDTIQIMVQNVGIDTINGSVPTLITAHYQLNGITTIVNDTITQQINPGDTILFSFNVLADFTVTTSDSVFNIVAWVDLMNDNVPSNDTATADVESFGVPNPPTVSNTYIPYASYATLTAISTDTILWYQYDTSTVALAGGATFVTPVLTDTTTYWVQAGIKISGTGANVAPMAVASASTCNTGPCTSFNDLNFGSCGSQ